MKFMKDKVRKKSISWFQLLTFLYDDELMYELARYGKQHKKVSWNRVCYSFFKMKFGASTTATIRKAYRYFSWDEEQISWFYIHDGGHWSDLTPLKSHVRETYPLVGVLS